MIDYSILSYLITMGDIYADAALPLVLLYLPGVRLIIYVVVGIIAIVIACIAILKNFKKDN